RPRARRAGVGAARIHRGARHELSRLSRRQRGTRNVRRESRGVRTRGRSVSALREASRRHARNRRQDDRAVRAVSKVALVRPPTPEAHVALMREQVRSDALDRPGVYRMISSDGEIVYVGKSKKVRSRLLSYFRCEYPEEKGARILREADRIEWE